VDALDFCGDDIQAIQVSSQIDALKEALTGQIDVIAKLLQSGKLLEQTGEEVAIAGAALLPVISQVLASTPGMISWAADIAAYFQVEDTYKSVDVTVPLTALQSCVASALIAMQEPVQPVVTVCFPNFHTFGNLTELPILVKFRECATLRDNLSARAAEMKALVEAAKLKEAELSRETRAHVKLAEAAYATSQSLIQAFDDFGKLMTAVPAGNSYSPLAVLGIREYLKKSNGQDLTHLLYLNVVSSGGEVSIRKFLWWTRGIVFLGGCVVTYVLADLAGKTLASGTLSQLSQTKYTRSQKTPLEFQDLVPS
jgi:hypothetical protein